MENKSKGETAKKGATKKKKWSTKQVLASPFAPKMPPPIPGVADALSTVLKQNFASPPLRREPRPSKAAPPQSSISSPKSLKGTRKPAGIVIGINEVTKGLEKEELALVVLARDVKQSILVSHVPVLCFTQNAKLVLLPGDGSDLGECFGIRRMLTFAVSKTAAGKSDEFPIANLILNCLSRFVVKLDYPWLAAAKGKGPLPTLPLPVTKPHKSIRMEEQEGDTTAEKKVDESVK